jgi:hypothetical protein
MRLPALTHYNLSMERFECRPALLPECPIEGSMGGESARSKAARFVHCGALWRSSLSEPTDGVSRRLRLRL